MNPVASWLLAFGLTSLTAVTLVVGNRMPAKETLSARDPAKLTAVEAEIILNRIREGDLTAIQGNLEKAKASWKEARDRGAGYWPIHEALGDSFARHGLDADAEREFETAATIASKQLGRAPTGLALKRASILARLKRFEPALNILIECGDPARLAGAMARLLKESPELMAVVTRAADTRDPRLWALVANVTKDPADRASAMGRYVRLAALQDPDLRLQAFRELTVHKRSEEALELVTAWAKLEPSNPGAYDLWGRMIAERGDRDRARLILSTIVDVRPGDPAAHARLGAAFRDVGFFPEAVAQFQEVARLRPEEPAGLQEIVATHLAAGNLEGAMRSFSDLKGKFENVAAGFRLQVGQFASQGIEAARKSGDAAKAKQLRAWCVERGFPEAGLFDIKVVMTWDAMSDVDLDVTEPGGETVNHGQPRSKAGAVYAFDNTQGRGPEHYTLPKAPAGKYRVGVHLHGRTPSTADIEVILFEETPKERRLKAQVKLDGSKATEWPLEFDIP